jgi:hypothetical protein
MCSMIFVILGKLKQNKKQNKKNKTVWKITLE